MKRHSKAALSALTCLFISGCFSTPTPLAPGLGGTVGVPHHGVQTDAVELPVRGPGFVRFRPHSSNYWGRPHFVKALESAAAEVARILPDSPPLVVGDLSAKFGGKIPGHNSHRTGRDVDLLFFVTTPSGVPIKSPGFVHIEPDGIGRVPDTDEYIRLDVDRQWLFFKLLLTSPDIGIQFMFVSRDVEALIIDYARARGEPLQLIWQAETVLLQPGDSTPHDDHVHVRIVCTPEEAVAGCSGGGPYWEWLGTETRLPELTTQELQAISADDPLDLQPEPEETAVQAEDA